MTRRHAVPILLAAALTGAPVLGTAGAVAAASAAQPPSHEMQPYPPRPFGPGDFFDDLADAALLEALANANERDPDAEDADEDEDENPLNLLVRPTEAADDVPPGDEFDPTRGLGGGDGDDDDDDDGDCGGGCGGGGCGPGCEARKQVSSQAAELPFTGAPVGLIAAAGGGLLAVGATGILLSVRRRRSSDAG
ncbi:LPXTG cell wall anchor domain-containing protein [Streptosporangium sandarakinum]|uniref:LPXTG cell wall anchor domain-containing protein n=1 Tax=Streptosporangium sandarakinum TaxID=1260955 RepID=UPI00368B685C